MIRETTAVGSKQVSMMLHETDGGTRLQARTSNNQGTGETLGPIVNSPYWLRLERNGNTITGKVSIDGTVWETVGSYNVSMSSTVLIGMALTPRDDNQVHWAKFDNVTSTVTGSGAGSGLAVDDSDPPTSMFTSASPAIAFSRAIAVESSSSRALASQRFRALDDAMAQLETRQLRRLREDFLDSLSSHEQSFHIVAPTTWLQM
jgi:hypothetical protein